VDLAEYKARWQQTLEQQIVQQSNNPQHDGIFRCRHLLSQQFRDQQGRLWSCDKEERMCIANNGAFFHHANVRDNFKPVCDRAQLICDHLDAVIDSMVTWYRSDQEHPNPIARGVIEKCKLKPAVLKSFAESAAASSATSEQQKIAKREMEDDESITLTTTLNADSVQSTDTSSESSTPVLMTTQMNDGFFEVETTYSKSQLRENATGMKEDVKDVLDDILFDVDEFDWAELCESSSPNSEQTTQIPHFD